MLHVRLKRMARSASGLKMLKTKNVLQVETAIDIANHIRLTEARGFLYKTKTPRRRAEIAVRKDVK